MNLIVATKQRGLFRGCTWNCFKKFSKTVATVAGGCRNGDFYPPETKK